MNEPVNIYIGGHVEVERIKRDYSKVVTQAHEIEGRSGPMLIHLTRDCYLLPDWPAISRALYRLPGQPIIYLYD
jgi:hypothetical protein